MGNGQLFSHKTSVRNFNEAYLLSYLLIICQNIARVGVVAREAPGGGVVLDVEFAEKTANVCPVFINESLK